MRHRPIVHTVLALAGAILAALPPPGQAATQVFVPAGTKVGLQFVTPVDSGKIATGAKVRFRVLQSVLGGRHVVIRAGGPVIGIVTEVTKPGIFGRSARVVVGSLSVLAVDGRPLPLRDIVISKATVSNSRLGAAGASVAGAVILGPIGLLAGAFVKGSYVSVPAGTVVIDVTAASANVRAP